MLLLNHCRTRNIAISKILASQRLRHCRWNCLRNCATEPSSSSDSERPNLVPLKSIPSEELGFSVLRPEANMAIRKAIVSAKFCSFGSSALGLCIIPKISSMFLETINDRPGVAAFMAVADTFLFLFALTPFLLHILSKRFVEDVFYNPKTKVFTTVHFGFFLQKRALRFTSDQVVGHQIDATKAAENAAEKKKFSLQLATCTVRNYPLLLLLEPEFYTDLEAFELLTKNIKRGEANDKEAEKS